MTTSNQLLPCPFCGGSAAYQRLLDGSKYGAHECGECGAQGPDVRTGYGPEEEWRDKATAAWNERSAAVPPAVAHGDEALEIAQNDLARTMAWVGKFKGMFSAIADGSAFYLSTAAEGRRRCQGILVRYEQDHAAMRANGDGEVQ